MGLTDAPASSSRVGQPSVSVFVLTRVVVGMTRKPGLPERGTHQLAVEIIDSEGHTLERTPNQPIHVKLISLDQKRRGNPCASSDYGVRPECPLKDKPPEDDDIPFVPFI